MNAADRENQGSRRGAAAGGFIARAACAIAAAALSLVVATPAQAQLQLDAPPMEAEGVDVIEKLGDTLPSMLRFTDEEGQAVVLDEFFDGEKPVVLALVYFDCPVICPVILDKLSQCMAEMDFTVGEDFNAVMVSFDPSENAVQAQSNALRFRHGYDKTDPATLKAGWPFLTGEQDQITALTEATGFQHKRLPNGEYSHPPVLVVLSPDRKITRYVYGLEYDPEKIEFSLLEASNGRIANSLGQRLAFLCYVYDPDAGAYTLQAFMVMRIAGVVTIIAIAIGLTVMFIGERARRSFRARAAASTEPTSSNPTSTDTGHAPGGNTPKGGTPREVITA